LSGVYGNINHQLRHRSQLPARGASYARSDQIFRPARIHKSILILLVLPARFPFSPSRDINNQWPRPRRRELLNLVCTLDVRSRFTIHIMHRRISCSFPVLSALQNISFLRSVRMAGTSSHEQSRCKGRPHRGQWPSHALHTEDLLRRVPGISSIISYM
jgi:hypothetical protein